MFSIWASTSSRARKGEAQSADESTRRRGGSHAHDADRCLPRRVRRRADRSTATPVCACTARDGIGGVRVARRRIPSAKRSRRPLEAMIAGLCERPLTFQAIYSGATKRNDGKVRLRASSISRHVRGAESKSCAGCIGPCLNGEVGAGRERRGWRKAGARTTDDDYTTRPFPGGLRQSSAEGAGDLRSHGTTYPACARSRTQSRNAGGGRAGFASAEKAYAKLRVESRGCQKPVAEQQPHREPRRADLRHQQTVDRHGGPAHALADIWCAVADFRTITTATSSIRPGSTGWREFGKKGVGANFV